MEVKFDHSVTLATQLQFNYINLQDSRAADQHLLYALKSLLYSQNNKFDKIADSS